MAQRHFLCHHAAEGIGKHGGLFPAHGIHQAGVIIGVAGHCVGAVGLAAATHVALIEGEHGEVRGEAAVNIGLRLAQVAARAPDLQQARAVARDLEAEIDVANLGERHVTYLKRPVPSAVAPHRLPALRAAGPCAATKA